MTRKAVARDFKPIRVIIVDDSASIRDSLSALIAKLPGVEIVGVAQNGREALDLIRAHRPDVVTLDIRMPEVTGIGVLEALRKEQQNPTVIILSGLAEIEYQRKCRELGAHYFFNKATEFEKVLEILNERVRGLQQTEPLAAQPDHF